MIPAALVLILSILLCGCGKQKTPVDIDLSGMSENMIYSAAFQMAENPQDYEGKTVRIKVMFTTMHSEAMDRDYYECSVRDKQGCCTEGIEFILPEGQEYPEVGASITVSGTYVTYEEDGGVYGQLINATLE